MGATAEPTDRSQGEEAEVSQTHNQQGQISDLIGEYEEESEPSDEQPPSPETEEAREEPEESTSQEEEPEAPTQEEEQEEEGFERPEEEEREEPESEETDEEPTTEDQLLEELRELKKDYAELEQRLEGEGEETVEEEPEAETEEVEEEEEELESELAEAQFISEEEHEQILEDADSMNELLQAFAAQLEQRLLSQIPELVQHTAQRQVSQQQVVREFWNNNPELQEHKEFVQHMANKVESENPDMGMREQLQETARRAKKELRIKEEAEERESQRQEGGDESQESRSPTTARKPRGKRGGQPEDTRDGQQKQIDSLIGEQL